MLQKTKFFNYICYAKNKYIICQSTAHKNKDKCFYVEIISRICLFNCQTPCSVHFNR
jgi:hypothetical protein